MPYLFLYLVLINLSTFIAYGLDKRASRKHQRRFRERTLHLLALLGGSPAALLAQQLLRHKTSKRSFQLTFWVIVIVQIAAVIYLWAG